MQTTHVSLPYFPAGLSLFSTRVACLCASGPVCSSAVPATLPVTESPPDTRHHRPTAGVGNGWGSSRLLLKERLGRGKHTGGCSGQLAVPPPPATLWNQVTVVTWIREGAFKKRASEERRALRGSLRQHRRLQCFSGFGLSQLIRSPWCHFNCVCVKHTITTV